MHRFIFLTTVFVCVTASHFAYSFSLSSEEQKWIDANPIVRFSIHEKYRPFLESTGDKEGEGIFRTLLNHLSKSTQQEFQPIWRDSDTEIFHQLTTGQIHFVIDPPEFNQQQHPALLLSDPVFWGQDVLVGHKRDPSEAQSGISKVRYFDRGYSKLPNQDLISSSFSSDLEHLSNSLIEREVEALVMPARLAARLIKQWDHSEIGIVGQYGHEPFAYRLLIAVNHAPLNRIIQTFLNNQDPIELANDFGLPNLSPITPNREASYGPWLVTLIFLCIGGAIIWDLQKKQAAQTLLSRALLKAKNLAEQANAAKSSFLATMSHEIRTPMNAILGIQELLLNNPMIPSHEKPLLKSAHNSAQSLLGILNQVLDLSKIEAGKLTLNPASCDLRTLIDDIHASFSPIAKKGNLILHTTIDARLAQVLMVDSLRFRQILQNLISNAIKFTKKGEIFFSVSVLADDHAGQLLEFRVIDTGIGMQSNEIELALQEFEQLSGSARENRDAVIQGTGLGLAITKRLLESMDSRLYFESAPGFGTNVHFSVALARTGDAATSYSSHTTSRTYVTQSIPTRQKIGGQDISALVVEDHAASRQILSLQLEALGFRVIVCESGDKALELIQDHHFDLLLTDQSIPGMQGSELSRKIRSLGNANLIIIGITADIYALESRSVFMSAGMNSVLIKPISLKTLEKELKQYFYFSEECSDNLIDSYSFDAFGSLVKNDPSKIILILEEIKKVHDESLETLLCASESDRLSKKNFDQLLHKIKGGALLLNAGQFIADCVELEAEAPLEIKISCLIDLLQEQNLLIERYKNKFALDPKN
ncbi:response regulator [Polynucleobacter paneuropaeus]|nr:response regulator [Polynucleobacter paneuropaeus]